MRSGHCAPQQALKGVGAALGTLATLCCPRQIYDPLWPVTDPQQWGLELQLKPGPPGKMMRGLALGREFLWCSSLLSSLELMFHQHCHLLPPRIIRA